MAPGIDRNIRKSQMARLRSMFRNPPAASGLSAFSVYSEDDLKKIMEGAPNPLRPFVFLLDSYMRPKPALLPMVVVDIPKTVQAPYELGNRKGRMKDSIVHCFGRTRGERDDVSSFIVDYFGSTFPVYTYTSGTGGDAGVFLENAELDDEIIVEEVDKAIGPDERREGTLDLWVMIHLRFRTKN